MQADRVHCPRIWPVLKKDIGLWVLWETTLTMNPPRQRAKRLAAFEGPARADFPRPFQSGSPAPAWSWSAPL